MLKVRILYIHSTQIYQCNVPFVITNRRNGRSISLKIWLNTEYVFFLCLVWWYNFVIFINICHKFLKSHEKYLKIVHCQKNWIFWENVFFSYFFVRFYSFFVTNHAPRDRGGVWNIKAACYKYMSFSMECNIIL